jgi:ATP-dependent Lon protease
MVSPRPEPSPPEAPLPPTLPVVPLKTTVVLPYAVQPLAINRSISVEAVNRALSGDRMLLLVLQREDADEPTAEQLHTVGTAAVVRQMARGQQGLQVLVEGVARVHVSAFTRDGDAIIAAITPDPEPRDSSIEVDAYVRRLRELMEKALAAATGLPADARSVADNIEDPLRLCYFLASLVDMKAEDKQLLLEENDLQIKLRAVATTLAREVDLLELKGRIESETQQEMSAAQRQYYLRQQLKQIREELGEQEGAEVRELRARVEAAGLPEQALTAVNREIDRLERMQPASPEYQMIRTYLDWVLDVPWKDGTEDRLDPVEARRVLDEDHYDLDKVKDRIIEYLAVRKLKGDMKGPILCFVGPPGVGKTSLGQSIARAMNRKFVRISLGGIRDEAEIRGHRRTYIGSMPGRIIQALKQAGSANPVFMLDEVDKLSVGFQGDPAAALLEVLDPAQNHTFRDHYLEIPYDLSRVLFIATANQLGPVHPALLDRMEIITLSGYTESEKVHIAQQYLIPRQLEEHGLKPGSVEFTEAALRRVIGEYTREAGVRNIERQVGTIARKIAARVAGTKPSVPSSVDTSATRSPAAAARADAVGGAKGVDAPGPTTAALRGNGPLPDVWRIDAGDVPAFLGPPRFRQELAFRTSRAGVATGVAWTETGGDVLFVEATFIPGGDGRLLLTGQLGEVMQESARAALSHVRSRAAALGLSEDFLRHADVHVHVPAGAIPKDGPSAGVTIATAIVSAARQLPVASDVAMTGEITLSGLVLPVGGIREKALAARRSSIKTFVLPAENAQDIDELPAEARDSLTFVPVSSLDEVLQVALPAAAPPAAADAAETPRGAAGPQTT